MPDNSKIIPALAPCGVYCEACPSFDKTCLGCAANDPKQSRRSKWCCKIRHCCYETKGLDFCIDCNEYPCRTVTKKLLTEHAGDPRFTYRFETPEVFARLKTMGLDKYIEYQKNRWRCEYCGGTIKFYVYKCSNCNAKLQ